MIAHKLFGLVDGSNPKPVRFLTQTAIGAFSSSLSEATNSVQTKRPAQPNPLHDEWIAKDHALITLINATLSPSAHAYIVGCSTSKDIRDTLEKHYLSNTRVNVVNLKSELQTISKKAGESINSYIQRIKELKDKLFNVSILIDYEDLIIYTTNGLPSEYNTFRTSMCTKSTSVSFEELHVLLISEESAIEK